MAELNFFERGLASLAPQWGLRRLSSKFALEQAQSAVRGYDAAKRGDRRTSNWRTSAGSANAEIAPALEIIRQRTRDMIRNNEWAASARRKLVAHIIGTGFVLRPSDDTAKVTKKRAAACWKDFIATCDPSGMADFNGIQAQIVGEVVEGGAAFVRWYLRPADWNLRIPLQCEVLEHDYLDTRKNESVSDGVIVNGIEYDHWGRRRAYWFFPTHPGEMAPISRGRWRSERVPASEVDHIFRIDRPGQVTGVPWFAPLLMRLRDVADYEEAEQIRKKIEACFTVFVTQPDGQPANIVQAGQQTRDDRGRKLEKIAPGMISYLPAGGDIRTAVPTANGGYADFLSQQLMAAAAGIGLTVAQMTGNLKDVNFTSLREGKLDFYQVLDQWQWLMVAHQLCRPAWQRVMAAAAGRGLVPTANIGHECAPPKRPWVDPLKDIKAEESEMALGLETWRDKVAARGYDPDERLEAVKREREALAEAGIYPGAAPAPAPPHQEGTGNEAETE